MGSLKSRIFLGWLGLSVSLGMVSWGQDLTLYESRTPAPLDVRKGEQTISSLSKDQRREVMSEFGGLLYMAQRRYTYEAWPGRPMSDCSANPSGPWCFQCEIITGHADAYYYFYQDPSRSSCSLQLVDVRFDVSDESVLNDFRHPVQSLLGDGVYSAHSQFDEMGSHFSGAAWRWITPHDAAHLFMDDSDTHGRGEGKVRFLWRRYSAVQSVAASRESYTE